MLKKLLAFNVIIRKYLQLLAFNVIICKYLHDEGGWLPSVWMRPTNRGRVRPSAGEGSSRHSREADQDCLVKDMKLRYWIDT